MFIAHQVHACHFISLGGGKNKQRNKKHKTLHRIPGLKAFVQSWFKHDRKQKVPSAVREVFCCEGSEEREQLGEVKELPLSDEVGDWTKS